ncbi:MAG: replicative DNA helicase, partial [Bacteroidetes bacterium]|nr:replicative DNA helicase [Bacteroidota bacterium]
DADMVLFIYRPEYYKIDVDEDGNSTAGIAEIIIAKHRNGALKDIPLRFIDKFAKFVDLDTEGLSFSGLTPNDSFEEGQPIRTIPSKMNDMKDESPPF